MAKKKSEPYVGCTIKELPGNLQVAAARSAMDINPANRPALERMSVLPMLMTALVTEDTLTPGFLAVLTTKYWGQGGVRLSVSFMEQTSAELRNKILAHMNAWNEHCNAKFEWSQSQGQVRISRGRGGYWSYLGTDVLQIAFNQPTMNLQGFTVNTSDAEYRRVVRHETGHTLGFPHEHMRGPIIARLDERKTVEYFRQTQGWDERTTRQQVLTPLEAASIMGTPDADDVSIMTYSLPATITRDGRPIPGGNDIDDNDKAFAAKLYPKADVPIPPPPPSGGLTITLPSDVPAGNYTLTRQS
jgi:hypothetical protein